MATNASPAVPAAVVGGRVPITAERLLEFLDLEMTERCILDCRHCYIRLSSGDREARGREMDTAFVCRIIKEAVSLGCLKIRFTGGEPLLRPDFTRVYEFAFSLGLGIAVATNATLITDVIADLWFLKKPIGLSISIYGWDRESFESVTRPCQI